MDVPNHRLVNTDWLLRLRWVAAVAQLVLLVGASVVGWDLPFLPLLGVISLGAVSNAALRMRVSRGGSVGEGLLGGVLALDVLLLTALLALSGGASNPLTFLYLFPVVLSALVVRASTTWGIVFLGGACYGSLFTLDAGPHAEHMRGHLVGMWLAYALCAPLFAFAITRIRGALARADADLARVRERSARDRRLASLATLAAGAAHELATPLGTIAIAAKELERQAPNERVSLDARLIRHEVDRCRTILEQLSADAGAGAGEGRELVDVLTLLDDIGPVRLSVDPAAATARVAVSPRLLRQALRRLVGNAREAGGDVTLRAEVHDDRVSLAVVDTGHGMTPDVLDRAGEPFFTTRPEGRGMGLGLFFARSIAEHHGGDLTLASTPGEGTVATLRLPRASEEAPCAT